MKHRADIQILRGISVIMVVLYHLGARPVQSGYLGVDVFFVISGFLMAVLYAGRKPGAFIARRFKRLVPAYFCVVAATLVLSFFLTTPNETAQVVKQTKFASFFLSNIGFWSQNPYFSKAEFNPLLHLWSLGVEIQFYLVVPLLYRGFTRFKLLLPATLILSLVLCFVVVSFSPKTSFFMLPLRLWEFLIGYCAAWYFSANGNVQFQRFNGLGLSALIGVTILILWLPINVESRDYLEGHPGLASLLVALLTAAILVLGLPVRFENSRLGRVLQRLGKYSYSIYLVHFPVIVLLLSSPFEGTLLRPPTIGHLLLIMGLVAPLSVMLHYWVEVRFKTVKITAALLVPVVSILVFGYVVPNVILNHLPSREKYVFEAYGDRSVYRCGKLARILNPSALVCDLTPNLSDPKKRVLFVGDSHADAIKTAFVEAAVKQEVKVYFLVRNNPLMKGGLSSDTILNLAKVNHADKIVLHYSPRSLAIADIDSFLELTGKSNFPVIFIDPVPVWPVHIPKAIYDSIHYGIPLPVQSRGDYMARNEELFNRLSEIRNFNFKRVSVIDYFCAERCLISTPEGKPLYFDSNHLTLTGSRLLIPLFTRIFSEENQGQ